MYANRHWHIEFHISRILDNNDIDGDFSLDYEKLEATVKVWALSFLLSQSEWPYITYRLGGWWHQLSGQWSSALSYRAFCLLGDPQNIFIIK